MKAIEISHQWWVIRKDRESKRGFAVVAGPFPEEWQAISACRVKDTWDPCCVIKREDCMKDD